MSEPVPAITRPVKVEALNSCSAYRISEACIACTLLAEGASAVQQVQEVAADGVVVGLRLNALAVVAAVVPVQQHRSQRGHQAVGDVARAGRRVVLFLSGSTQPSTETPVRITSIGWAAAGNASSTVRTLAGRPRSALRRCL